MCGGFEYAVLDPETGQQVRRKVFFPIPHAKIPILTETGVQWTQWGKRKGEDPEIDVPVTGWARILSLKEGKWNQYQPSRVKIPAIRWMEKDAQKSSHWFEMDPTAAMLGIRIEKADRTFVYIVTRPAEGPFAQVHDRMPLLIQSDAPRLDVSNPVIPSQGTLF